jgi:menaquinone-dependent protoporphyrinogen oxidase
MSRFLIAYASTHGHTAKIAHRIADVIRAEGHSVDVHDDLTETDPDVMDYDAVIIGASIHAGHHQPALVEWTKHHSFQLSTRPSAFFSVCLTAAEDNDTARETARDYVDDFEETTGWTPRRRSTFAGALQFREYNFPTRLMMRVLMKQGGHPTDIHHDYDYTDWDAVEAFAGKCAKLPSLASV